VEIKKEKSHNLYYINDALEFIIQNKLDWKEISSYFEENLNAYISYFAYFRTHKEAEFAMNYLEGLIIMDKLLK